MVSIFKVWAKSSTAAEIIRWAHRDAKDKEVASRPFALNDDALNYIRQFIAPVLISKTAKGLATLDDVNVRQEVDRAVRNKKKAEVVKQPLQAPQRWTQSPKNTVRKSKPAKSFLTVFHSWGKLSSLKVVAVADILPANQLSAPFAGNEGIYIISVNAKTPAPALPNGMVDNKQETQRLVGRFLGAVVPALKDKADIEDNRGQFYE